MNAKLAQLMRAMINYDGGDVPRIQHFVKVHDFAAKSLVLILSVGRKSANGRLLGAPNLRFCTSSAHRVCTAK